MKPFAKFTPRILINIRTFIVITILYTIICTLLLHPYVLHPTDTLNGDNDVLLNIWIMQWTFHQLFYDPLHLFDGNIFYPNKLTLAYSEVLFPNTIINGIITTISGNPILAYNLIFFLMIIGSALAMFYFTRSFTNSNIASFVAGIVFGFHMKNMGFLQLLSSLWIPLSFLFFFRSFYIRDRKSIILTCLFFTLQFLSCVYYGIYLMLCFMILVPFFMYSFRKKIGRRFIVWSLIGVLSSGVVLSPFVYQYYRASKDFGFTRNIEVFSGADLKDFIMPSINKLILRKIRKFISPIKPHKKELGFGILALIIATYGVISFIKQRRASIKNHTTRNHTSKRLRTLRILFFGVLAFILSSLAIYQILGVKRLFFLFYTLTKNNYIFFFRVAVIGLSLYFLYRYVLLMKEKTQLFPKIFYTLVFIGITAIVLSMGDTLQIFGRSYGTGPYLWLNKYLPWFSGLRVYKRFAIIANFSLAFITGMGAKAIIERLKPLRLRYTIFILLCFLILAEYNFTKVKMKTYKFTHGRNIPEVYTWLKTVKGNKIIAEFPFVIQLKKKKIDKDILSRRQTNLYMYYSTYHWKTLLNGRSGFFPNSDLFLGNQLYLFPTYDNLYLLKQIGVDYIIIHQIHSDLKDNYIPFTKSTGILKMEKQFDRDIVFSFNKNYPKNWYLKLKSAAFEFIPHFSFKISSPYPDEVNLQLTDGKLKTPTNFFNYDKDTFFIQFDFENPENITKFEIFYTHLSEISADLTFEVSENGNDWKKTKIFADKYELFLNLLEGSKIWKMNYYIMDGKPIRYFKLLRPECFSGEVKFCEIRFFREK